MRIININRRKGAAKLLPHSFSTDVHPTAIAEDVGFEPTEPCSSLVFKTSAFVHSANLP